MTNEAEDRGDTEVIAAGDESGDTDGLEVKEVKEEVKEEAKDEGLDEGSTKVETKEPQIPKKRFDEAVGKARREAEAAAARAAELEAQLAAQRGKIDAEKVEGEIEKLEDDLEAARADGNKDKAKAIRLEIRAREQMLADARAEVRAAHATATAVEQIRYDTLVAKMETEHPELNPDNEGEYNQEVVDELLELKEAFEAKGEASSVALRKALSAVYRGGPKPKEEPKKDEEDTKAKKAEAEASQKREAAVKKGLETKGKQPADTTKAAAASDSAGKSGTAKDVSRMSNKEFDKIDEDELKRLRGDDL